MHLATKQVKEISAQDFFVLIEKWKIVKNDGGYNVMDEMTMNDKERHQGDLF